MKELYNELKLKLDSAEIMQHQIEKLLEMQNAIVEQLEYETSELYSKLSEEEKESIEIF